MHVEISANISHLFLAVVLLRILKNVCKIYLIFIFYFYFFLKLVFSFKILFAMVAACTIGGTYCPAVRHYVRIT